MKIHLPENEAVLLITGDILIAIGGVILGITFENTLLRFYLAPFCAIFFGLGGFFDYKSIKIFSTKLHKLKDEIKTSQEKLDETIKQVDDASKKLKETNRALFGSESGVFSNTSWHNTVDHQFDELKREIRKLHDRISTSEMRSRRF